MQTIETEVQVTKTKQGAEGAAARLNRDETIPGIRYTSRKIAPKTFAVLRVDGEAVREGTPMRAPRERGFGGERDVASMRGQRLTGKQRGNGRVFA